MAQKIAAEELHALGIAHEIVPRDAQRDRARAIADQLKKLSPLTLRYSRFSMNSRLRREVSFDTHPSYGMLGISALEMFGPKRSA